MSKLQRKYHYYFRFALGLASGCVALNLAALQKELRDPTAPLGYRSNTALTQAQTLQLQAIFLGAGRKEAIISGVIVKQGDKVMGKQVVTINPDNVVVRGASGDEVLKLRPSIFSQ